jgi:hypothetical protein
MCERIDVEVVVPHFDGRKVEPNSETREISAPAEYVV